MRFKKLLTITTWLSVVSFTLGLSGCGTVPIYDQELCGDKGPIGAKCWHTLTPETRAIDKKTWDDLRFGQVCTAPESIAQAKAALEKLCRRERCRYETKAVIEDFFLKLQTFQTEAETLEASATKAP